ncbi:MAG: hypothetical protein U0T82_11430 [Bacteroidales bacterium]
MRLKLYNNLGSLVEAVNYSDIFPLALSGDGSAGLLGFAIREAI